MSDFTGEVVIHNGIDIAHDVGGAVQSAAAGRVLIVEVSSGYGLAIVIEHGYGLTTLYAHLSSAQARIGDVVDQGTIIGYSGDTGRSSGPHVHFQIDMCRTGRDKQVRCYSRNPNRYIKFTHPKKKGNIHAFINTSPAVPSLFM